MDKDTLIGQLKSKVAAYSSHEASLLEDIATLEAQVRAHSTAASSARERTARNGNLSSLSFGLNDDSVASDSSALRLQGEIDSLTTAAGGREQQLAAARAELRNEQLRREREVAGAKDELAEAEGRAKALQRKVDALVKAAEKSGGGGGLFKRPSPPLNRA